MHPVLTEMIRTGQTFTADGRRTDVRFQILAPLADALYRTVREARPTVVVEVGMAYGVSSLAVLSALEDIGHGRLISIDPFQTEHYEGGGITAVQRADLSHRHALIEEPDYLALPQLLRNGTRVDFGYIDGYHTFDAALLDFLYLDRMLSVGGIVAFNDCSMPAVHKALNFVLTHRRYDEVDVGLPPMLGWRSRRQTLLHGMARLIGMDTNPAGRPREADRYFRKREAYEPAWDFFEPF